MAIVNVTGISGINSITAQSTSLNFFTAAGNTLSIGASVSGNITGDVTGNVTGNVNATGLSTFSGGLLVGTGTSISSPGSNILTLGVNNAERLRINTTGIGIGTTNPDQLLTLQSGGDSQISFKNTSGVSKAYVGTDGAFGSASTDDLRIRSDSSNIIFGFSGTEKSRLTSAGNFGIGVVPWTGSSDSLNFKTLVANYQANGSMTTSSWADTTITLTAASNFVFAKIIAVGHENGRNNGFREYFVSYNIYAGWSTNLLVTSNQGNDYGLVDVRMNGSTVQVKAVNNASSGQYRLYVTHYLT